MVPATPTPASPGPHGAPAALHAIRGCMFAGKTEALIDLVQARPPDQVRVFKHVIDDRYDPRRVVSHRQRSCDATPIRDADAMLTGLNPAVRLVAIDEGHFFDARLTLVCQTLVARGIDVLVTALDRDCWGRPFDVIGALCTVADRVTVKRGACARCGAPSERTQRLIPIVGENLVGGGEAFEPRCLQCWTTPPGSDHITRRASNTGP